MFIRQFVEGLKETLPNKIESIYLHGSLAMDDFNDLSSDIDIVVILSIYLNQEEIERLKFIHNELVTNSKWGSRLEVSYLIVERFFSKNIPLNPRLYFNSGNLSFEKYGYEWYFEKQIIIDYGRLLYGANLKDQLENVDIDVLVHASKQMIIEDWIPLLDNKDILTDEYLVFGVLTMCRIFYLMENRQLCTQGKAASWMIEKMSQKSQVINSARTWHKDEKYLYRNQALEFIMRVIEKCLA